MLHIKHRDRYSTQTNIWYIYGGSAGKESACNAGDLGSIPGLGRFPGEGKSYPLQYSGLENSMDYIGHRVAKSQRRPSDFHYGIKLSWGIFYSLTNLLGETWLQSLLWNMLQRPVTLKKKKKEDQWLTEKGETMSWGHRSLNLVSVCSQGRWRERAREICEKSLPWQGRAVWILCTLTRLM